MMFLQVPGSVDDAAKQVLHLTDSPLINIMLFLLLAMAGLALYKNTFLKKEPAAAPAEGTESSSKALLAKMDEIKKQLDKMLERDEKVSEKMLDKIVEIEKTMIEIKIRQNHEA